ncbi:MAG TPA: Asp-tRNA(Asn)/Glu-tRNA(Gln) amidotransferase subunit GatC [Patescibacteria group bacterium]|nr:Asp-tRNA(Asn)/Glu-tRNA(Gln) amidotransferase subunit GatC [Patescibacteria group bacterium]
MTQQPLTPKDTKKIAKLANLQLSPEELEKFSAQLSAILEYVEKLKNIDTSNVPETSQVTGLVNVTRNDEVKSVRYIKKGTYYTADAVFE